jgi:hypothetical protein
MALETAFQLLCKRLRLLKEAVDELQLNISGDYHPQNQSPQQIDSEPERDQAPHPVQQLADAVCELQGGIEEAQQAAAGAQGTLHYQRDLLDIQLALIAIQRCMNRVLKTFIEEVTAYEAIKTLFVMGHRKGGKWPAWIELVRTVIEACQRPLYETFEALLECWQELSDKLNANGISLRTTNIGQQITTCDREERTAHESA